MTPRPNDAILSSWALSLHGKSPGTRNLYLRTANWFADWLAANGRPDGGVGDLLEVTRQDAEAWFGSMREAGLAAATIRSRWIALRNLYGWLLDEEEIDANPLAKVKVDKANPEPIRVLTAEDLKALLKACEGRDFLDRRDLALIRVLASTGLRLAEAANLRVGDVDLAKRLAYIPHGKGDKARWIRFDPGTATAVDRYLRARARHRHAHLDALWLARLGPFSVKGIPIMLARRAELAGIGHLHAHQLRHTFASRFLEGGGTEGDLMRLGGWENAEVMRRYGSATAVDRALAAYDQVNPLGQL
jgi:site-specific recombinase XerD